LQQLHPTRSASFVDTRDASDFVPEFSQRVAPETSYAIFSPDWADNHSSFETIAYAIYEFELPGWSGQLTLHTDWPTQPKDYGKLWLGLSNWEKDRWDWYNGAPSGDPALPSSALDVYKDVHSRVTYVAVVLLGQTSSLLRKAWFSGMSHRGDWWMYGRDARHTNCSRFTGPAEAAARWTVELAYKELYQGGEGQFIGYNNTASAAYDSENTLHIPVYDVVGLWQPGVFALNADGSTQWYAAIYGTNSPGRPVSPAIGDDGSIFLMVQGPLLALTSEGITQWSVYGHLYMGWYPAIGPEGHIYIIGFGNGSGTQTYLHALNDAGEQLWEYYFGDCPTKTEPSNKGRASAPSVAPDGTVYVGIWDGSLFAFDSAGGVKWTYQAGGAVETACSIAADGTVYFATAEPKLYAVHPDGTPAWSVPLAGAAQGMAAIARDATLRVPCSDGRLYCLDPDGAQRWSYATGVSHSAASLDAAGTAYIGSEDGHLYAINADGSLKWAYAATDEVWAQPTLGEDGAVHFFDIGGWFHCIGPGAG
jgi:outer membrane protein assembly factor BamB